MVTWEIAEYVGEALVFVGVIGEIRAEWSEPERKRLGRIASIVLVVGLALSLVALIGANERFNATISDLNATSARLNEKASNADERSRAMEAVAEAERLKRVQIEKSLEWRRLSEGASKALCEILPPQRLDSLTIVVTYWNDPEPALYASEFRKAIGACRPFPGRPDIREAPSLGAPEWSFPIQVGVWLHFPRRDTRTARLLAAALRANNVLVTVGKPQEGNRVIFVGPRAYPEDTGTLISGPGSGR